MSNANHDDAPDPVDGILAEYFRRVDRGEQVDRAALIAQHPEHADELREFFAASDAVDGAVQQSNHPPDQPQAPLDVVHYFGDYELLEELGRGGMGVVYKARQLSVSRIVAVKMVLAGQLATEAEVRRFRGEAEAAANLDHPGIVPVFEVGQHDGRQYYSMGYVEGESLKNCLVQNPFAPRKAAEIIKEVAEAVEYAHANGVIHRDLKPANIIIDSQARIRVMDFGLAKRVEAASDPTVSGAVLGSPSYMPPEQAAGLQKEIGPASDVYSLGATLYELLTGRPPFRADTPSATLLQVLCSEPVSPRMLNTAIDRDMETICLKCLEKERSRRYASAQDLAADLSRYLRGEPILARPIGRAARSWRWCKRQPVVASLTAAVALTLVVGVVVSWFAVVAHYNEQRAVAGWTQAEENSQRADHNAAEARSNLALGNFQAARLAGERGQWQQQLTDLKNALEDGYPDSVAIALERIRALGAVCDMAKWAKEIDALLQRDDLGTRQGPALLWQASRLRAAGKEEEGFKRMRQALDAGLPPADAAYARGMLAETSPESARFLREALQIDPFHHDARVDLCGLLTLMAAGDEARQLAVTGSRFFPDDPSFSVGMAIQDALKGDKKEALGWLQRCRSQLDSVTVAQLESLVGTLAEQCAGEANQANERAAWKVLQTFRPFMEPIVEQHPAGIGASSLRPFRIPRPAKQAYMTALPAMRMHPIGSIRKKNHKEEIDALGKAAQIHPEGLFLFFRLYLLDEDGRFAEVESAAVEAAKCPSLFPALTRDGWLAASAYVLAAYVDKGRNPADLKRVVEHLRRYVASGPVTAEKVNQVVGVLHGIPDVDLVRRLLADGFRQQPQNIDFLRAKAEVELRAGEYQTAVRSADEVLKRVPDDAKAKQYKADAIAKLKKIIEEEEAMTFKTSAKP